MLKIKDNVDLKDLEKYGFKKYFGYAKYYNKSLTCSIDIDFKNYIIINIKNNDPKKYDLFDDLYDLIKADMVERWWKMSKTEYAWVIQRNDGRYFSNKFTNIVFVENIALATIYLKNWKCELRIKQLNLQNCHPVKVEIRVVGE